MACNSSITKHSEQKPNLQESLQIMVLDSGLLAIVLTPGHYFKQ